MSNCESAKSAMTKLPNGCELAGAAELLPLYPNPRRRPLPRVAVPPSLLGEIGRGARKPTVQAAPGDVKVQGFPS